MYGRAVGMSVMIFACKEILPCGPLKRHGSGVVSASRLLIGLDKRVGNSRLHFCIMSCFSCHFMFFLSVLIPNGG